MGSQPYSAEDNRARWPRTVFATLLLALLLGIFISAGTWQLRRADEKSALENAFSAGTAATTTGLPIDDLQAAEYRYRRFELYGHYLPEKQILLDNIVQDGRVGYQVLTPFRTGSQTILVNRGWVPADLDRTVLPAVPVAAGDREISARLNFLPRAGIKIASAESMDHGWPQRMLYPSRDELSAALDLAVPDYQLWLDADQPDGYEREWKAVAVGPARHYGYAIQWFAFAALAILFYVLLTVRWKRRQDEAPDMDLPDD